MMKGLWSWAVELEAQTETAGRGLSETFGTWCKCGRDK